MIDSLEVSMRFGERLVLDDITFEVPAGSITAFVGPNGAGKTTMMKIACGLLQPTSGVAMIDEKPFASAATPLRSLGICLAPESLPRGMSGPRFLTYAGRTQGGRTRSPVELFHAVGLEDENLSIGRYSTGMKQRLCVALCLLGEPNNLILDEPMNGLDLVGVRWLRDILRAEADRGVAILLSSHILSELAVIADRVVMISHGKVVRQGSIQDVVGGQGSGGVYIEGRDRDDLARIVANAGWGCERRGLGLLVQQGDPVVVARLLVEQGASFRHLSQVDRSLEDAFFETANQGAE